MMEPLFNDFGRGITRIRDVWQKYKRKTIDLRIDPADDMFHRDWDLDKSIYVATGEQALSIILQAMLICNNYSIGTILDMPCGFGRVIRHIHAAFPDARVYACDLYDNRIDYCAETFHSIPFKSKEKLAELEFPENFDLIWCGSLLSHLPEPLFTEAFQLFSRSLNDNGIAIVTTLGRISPFIHHECFKYLSDESFRVVEEGFQLTGFGYADYNLQSQFDEQATYGIAVVSPSYLMKTLEDDYSLKICGYLESGWVGQQDVVILQKTPIEKPRVGSSAPVTEESPEAPETNDIVPPPRAS